MQAENVKFCQVEIGNDYGALLHLRALQKKRPGVQRGLCPHLAYDRIDHFFLDSRNSFLFGEFN